MEALERNATWELVEKPKSAKVLSTKWVLREKFSAETNETILKARLVARGFEPMAEGNELHAPAAKLSTLRILLSVYCCLKLELRQIDMKNAFLNGKLKDEVFIEIPKYMKTKESQVLLLNKAIYGLKEAPLIWNQTVDRVLKKSGFQRSDSDYCLYVFREGELRCYLVIYVDDILIGSNYAEKITETLKNLQAEFGIRDLG